MTTRLYDISPPLSPAINVWPGDSPLTREVLCDMKQGANITLSTLRTTVHVGSHADGPNHYSRDASGIGERSLAYFIGPCQVIGAPVARASRVRVEDLQLPPSGITAPRVLIKTSTFPDHRNWNADFAGLDPALVDWLSEQSVSANDPTVAPRGVITVGVDAPSVDLQNSKDLPAHAAFARHDMTILEGLVLKDVPAGTYELIALPLKLMSFDASPIRAILRA
jgi:arylformamidase